MGIQDMRYTNRHLMYSRIFRQRGVCFKLQFGHRSYSDEQIIRVAPMRMSYQRQSLALGWTACRHPEGQLYFRNIEQRTWTNVWLYDTHNLEAVNNFTMQLRFDIEQQNDLPSDTEAVVHIQEFEDGTMEQSYYLVSASIRTIFWLEEVDVSLLTLGMVPVYENSHLESAQQMQYWIHVEMFPDDFAIHTELLDEVVDFLLWQSFDARTSETSTAPMSPEELDQLLRGVKEVRVGKHSGSVCVVARICHFSYRERFTNFYGEKAARLERHRSIFKEPFWSQPGRSWFFLVVSPMLLYLPDQYLEQIEKVWIDGKVVHRPWSTFITGLQRDWESSMTPSTVLLTANVGFLAIQSVDSSTSFRSAAQIASYISTLCSVGSLLLCTILSRQHRNNAHGTAAEAVQYLARRSQTIGGLQLLAITFSLLVLSSRGGCWGSISPYAGSASTRRGRTQSSRRPSCLSLSRPCWRVWSTWTGHRRSRLCAEDSRVTLWSRSLETSILGNGRRFIGRSESLYGRILTQRAKSLRSEVGPQIVFCI
ncbi:hypothetical protein B0H21DRAFT_329202 [Amylocystis lapponica]|nr:hypothetical protein B0H21DRAFT_329202 [Amylocystis lapponica]